jgi:MFS family permease
MRGLTRYQWTVFFAAWLGWGFDIFDAMLFNFVAPNAIPSLLGLEIGSPEAKDAVYHWTGIMTSALLVGWAVGGIIFGKIADKIGRTKTLALTMAMYSIGTALCAFAPNIWILLLCRLIAALGIGGEWAAGAAMVAEVIPGENALKQGRYCIRPLPSAYSLPWALTM